MLRAMKALRLGLFALIVTFMTPPPAMTAKLRIASPMPSLARADAWLNSRPLSTQELRGKVVLVDFWTYTCINWRRTLPYLRAWDAKYRDHGLVIVGVHTPEFSFERQVDNVRRAAQEQGVDYPIALDGEYAIWKAFDNHYWPAVYLVDARGHIRHQQFGEGDYEQLERVIQKLLADAGRSGFARELVTPDARGAEVAADWNNLGSPETYVGSQQAERKVSATSQLKLNQWALTGDWSTRLESALLNKAGGRIRYRFHARDVHVVMAPTTRSAPIRFRVSVDGQPPRASHGVDVDAEGNGTLDQPRMYQLIRQPPPIADRQIEIEFLDAGAEVFVFTFG
jgi:thiol-disulfide isomerase/thioredoxin